MELKCAACEAKDKYIEFLQGLVKDFMEPLKPSNQNFVPKYVNEVGEIVEVANEETEQVVLDDEPSKE